jgi:TetR/AcrR family transcriptional regulator, cholesterol catabolism regulator
MNRSRSERISPNPDNEEVEAIEAGPARQRRRTMRDVLRIGAEVIARKGFKETSIRDIADALGVTKSTIYHHVRSKDQLLFDIISNYQAQGPRIIDAARRAGPDPLLSLKAFIHELVLMNAEDPVMATLLARELRSLKGDHLKQVLEFRHEYESYVRGLVLDGQALGIFRTIDARLATIGIMSMANALYQWYRPGNPFSPEVIAATYEAILLNGLTKTDLGAAQSPG